MTITTLTIEKGINKTSFEVVHNLDEFCFSLEKAVKIWSVQHTTLTPEMFCRYIRQRNSHFICMPLSEALKVAQLFNNKA